METWKGYQETEGADKQGKVGSKERMKLCYVHEPAPHDK